MSTEENDAATDEPSFAKGTLALPKLKVTQEKYCDQETTDRIMAFLEETQPDLLDKIYSFARNSFHSTRYYQGIAEAGGFLEEEDVDIGTPRKRLGIIDLLFELHRRMQMLKGNPDPQIKGCPLAEEPDHPLPPLAWKEVQGLILKSKLPPEDFVSQELADAAIDVLYKRRPDLLYEKAEALRRGVPTGKVTSEINNFLKSLQDEVPTFPGQRIRIMNEVSDRLKVMCHLRPITASEKTGQGG